MDLIDLYNKEFTNNAQQFGLRGSGLAAQRQNFKPVTEEDEKRIKSIDYLKDGVKLSEIHSLAKNKKLSNNKIKQEIKKLLKNPEELIEFLKSFTKKEETKEVTASGAGVGMFSGQLSGPVEEEKPKKVEATEASSSGAGVGAYETNRIWAKTNTKKDWKPSRKTQIPGGNFVQVKKKCKKFPYCNQGDIKALNITEDESIKRIIQKMSGSYNLHEDHIKDIILHELRKTNK
jgi:hypothetical protein